MMKLSLYGIRCMACCWNVLTCFLLFSEMDHHSCLRAVWWKGPWCWKGFVTERDPRAVNVSTFSIMVFKKTFFFSPQTPSNTLVSYKIQKKYFWTEDFLTLSEACNLQMEYPSPLFWLARYVFLKTLYPQKIQTVGFLVVFLPNVSFMYLSV